MPYYFASDTHLGHGSREECRRGEKVFIDWLNMASTDADAIFLVGDIFDFWYEYKRVVPKGFTRLLGKFSELTDRGVKIYFFTGNHDMWQSDYLQSECGVELCQQRRVFDLAGKRVSVVHGDEIYARHHFGARVMNAGFRNSIIRWLFSHLVHPDVAMRFGNAWSSGSRKSKLIANKFRGEQDYMVQFARKDIESGEGADYYVFGHNHCSEDYALGEGRRALFLGEWFYKPCYAVLDDEGNMSLKRLNEDKLNEKLLSHVHE